MMIYNDYFFYIIHLFVLFFKINASIKNYRFEHPLGSTIVLPPCLSTLSSSINDVTVRRSLIFFAIVNMYFLKNLFWIDNFI
jgi:hypothetical protein